LKATATPTERVLLEEMQVLSARVAELESRPTFTYDASSGFFGGGTVVTSVDPRDPTTRSGVFGSRMVVTSVDPKNNALFASDKAFVRNLEGKPAVITDYSTDRDGKVTVTVEGEQVRLTKEQWEKLPLWTGSFPLR
jgi:hypothetical protein